MRDLPPGVVEERPQRGRPGTVATLPSMPHIIIKDGAQPRTEKLQAEVTALGRVAQGSAGIVIKDPSLSRQHAEIRKKGEGYVIVDLGSRNGTFVNGVQTKEQPLAPGDKIELGNIVIVFDREIAGRDYAPRKKGAGEAEPAAAAPDAGETKRRGDSEKHRRAAPSLATPDLNEWHRVWSLNPVPLIAVAGLLVLVIGGLSAFSRWRSSQVPVVEGNLLAAGTFEEGIKGWEAAPGSKAALSASTDAAHSGKGALAIDASGGALVQIVQASTALMPEPGRACRVSGWIRGDAFNGKVSIGLRWFRAEEDLPCDETSAVLADATSAWTLAEGTVTPPHDAVSARCFIAVIGKSGKVVVDDLSVVETAAAAEDGSRVGLDAPSGLRLEIDRRGVFGALLHGTPVLAFGHPVLTAGAESFPQTLVPSGAAWSTKGSTQSVARAWMHPTDGHGFDGAVSASVDASGTAVGYELPGLASAEARIEMQIPWKTGRGPWKVTDAAGERTLAETFTAKEATGLSLGLGDSELRWTFDGPMTVEGDRAGGLAELTIRNRGSTHVGFHLSIERAARAATNKNDLLPQGTAFEAQNAPGKAIALYEAEVKADALSPKGAAAEQRLKRLEAEATVLLDRARSGQRMAQQFARPVLCDPEIESCRAAAGRYAGCHFFEDFTFLAAEIAGVRDALRDAGTRADAERLWNLAQSAADAGQPAVARAYCDAIAGQHASTDWAGRAKELKAKLDANPGK